MGAHEGQDVRGHAPGADPAGHCMAAFREESVAIHAMPATTKAMPVIATGRNASAAAEGICSRGTRSLLLEVVRGGLGASGHALIPKAPTGYPGSGLLIHRFRVQAPGALPLHTATDLWFCHQQ